MLWYEFNTMRKIISNIIVLCLAVSGAGCFQPIHAINPSSTAHELKARLSKIEIMPITGKIGQEDDSRIGIELRNDLAFLMYVDSYNQEQSEQKLKITLRGSSLAPLSDKDSGRPEAETFTLDAEYSLINIKTNKIILTGTAFGRVSFDSHGQQRFARLRGLRDAQNRAAQLVSGQIHSRLLSHFATQN